MPNKGCGGRTGIVVSEDNGLNWTLRTIVSSTSGETDPPIGIGAGGKTLLLAIRRVIIIFMLLFRMIRV